MKFSFAAPLAWLKNFHPGYALLSLLLALLLWTIAHSEALLEREYELPVVTTAAPQHLVLVRQNFEQVNIRVRASRALLSNIDERELFYTVDLSSATPGRVQRGVDIGQLESRLPQSAELVSRFPTSIRFDFERKQTRAVRVRPELRGDPAPGFRIGVVYATPARVRLTGARSEILGLRSIATEVVDIDGARESLRRSVLLPLAEQHGWFETYEQVEVRVEILPVENGASATPGFAP